ncbi:MAG: hypothetical protein J6R13_07715, partial [Alistipes sp.]|nr:hypothetical protein [Alistipes sp.]
MVYPFPTKKPAPKGRFFDQRKGLFAGNASVANDLTPLSQEELDRCRSIREELGTRFCRRCGYCLPCAAGIHIPSAFTLVNYLRHYQLADWAKQRYDALPAHAE